MQKVMNDYDGWIKFPYMVRLGPSFQTFQQVMEYILTTDTPGADAGRISDMLKEGTPAEFTVMNVSDTSVGGNNVINPYPQFNRDDDIIHPLNACDNTGEKGMGRVYSEIFDRQQQILYLTMGVPEFSGALDFYADSISNDIARLMHTGDTSTMMTIGSLLGGTAKLAFSIAFLPLKWLGTIYEWAAEKYSITKYYDLKPTMALYYRMVNSLMAQIAVSMGLIENAETMQVGGGKTTSNYKDQYVAAGVPTILARNELDIYHILNKRLRMLNQDSDLPWRTNDDLIEERVNAGYKEKPGFMDGAWNMLVGAALGGDSYIAFKVERSTDVSESISNSTGESSLASTLNSKSRDAQDAMFSIASGKTGVAVFDSMIKGVTDFVSGAADGMGMSGLAAVTTGAGRFDIPEVWKDSSFAKSYNFSIKLRTPTPDPVSIFQCLYIPLCMILAAALPRAVGKNTYTSPFLVRAYCKGMFSVPLGIIDSVTIRRGRDEHGWTYGNLPTCIDVDLTIKDLSPAMFLSISDGLSFSEIFGTNSIMQEYISTLSGLGLAERTYMLRNWKRKINIAMQIFRSTKLNPLYYGNIIGHSGPARLISGVIPWTTVPNK